MSYIEVFTIILKHVIVMIRELNLGDCEILVQDESAFVSDV